MNEETSLSSYRSQRYKWQAMTSTWNSCERYTIDMEAFIQYFRNKRSCQWYLLEQNTVHQALKIIHVCVHADTVSRFECDGKISQGVKVNTWFPLPSCSREAVEGKPTCFHTESWAHGVPCFAKSQKSSGVAFSQDLSMFVKTWGMSWGRDALNLR